MHFQLGFCGMKFQITNSSVVKLVWMNSMLVLMNFFVKRRMLGF